MAKKIHGIDDKARGHVIEDEATLEAEWKAIVKEVNDFNDKSKEKALAAFNAGPVPGIMRSACRARAHMLRNIELVEQGKAPQSLVDFNREDMVEMLHAQTYVEYPIKTLGDDCLPEEFECYTDYLDHCLEEHRHWLGAMFHDIIETEEYKSWLALFGDLQRYLHSAAALAKAIGSSAARLYLRAWKIMEDSQDGFSRIQNELSEEEAQTVMRLERVAAERLQIDLLYAELKPYDPQKKENRAGNGAKAGE